MTFLESIFERAKQDKQTIGIPECTNPVMMSAAVKVRSEGIADVVFIGDPDEVKKTAQANNIDISGIEIIDPADEAMRASVAEKCKEIPEIVFGKKALMKRMQQPLYLSLGLEAIGKLDCTFAGLDATTFEVVMAGTAMIGLAEGVATASCFFAVELEEFEGMKDHLIGMSDGGVTLDPTPEQLAGIAISCCETYEALKGEKARCAMLSYSTVGSGAGPDVDRVCSALKLANEKRPDLYIDGEFQADAALIERVAAKKVGRPSEVAGKANVLIFPDIAACNIGSKLVQLTAKCNTYGPLLQGFKKPVFDCSRSDTEERIITNMAFSCVLGAYQKKNK